MVSKMVTTRAQKRVRLSRTTNISRRAAATALRPKKLRKRDLEIQKAKTLQRQETRKRLKEARVLAGRRLLLYLPIEIHFLIYNYLWPGPLIREVYIFQPGKTCCKDCGIRYRRMRNIGSESAPRRVPVWSPRVLLELSHAHRAHWRAFYRSSTRLLICPGQVAAYQHIFIDRQMARDRAADGSPVLPVCSMHVNVVAANIELAPLHALFEVRNLFPMVTLKFLDRDLSNRMPDDTINYRAVIEMLERWYHEGRIDELLPGAGKIARLFLDGEMNLWLHPDPTYLASFPALDSDLRNSLHELWWEVRIGIHLLILPRAKFERSGCIQFDNHLWNESNGISFVRCHDIRLGLYSCNIGTYFIVKPRPHVLPRGRSLLLLDFVVNEPRLRETNWQAVYVELVSKEDRKFRIRLKHPDGVLGKPDPPRLEDTHTAERHM